MTPFDTDPIPSREAIHEAGHLLCIWQVGFVATDLTLVGEEDTGGSVGWEDPRGLFDLDHLARAMQVDVAGTAAEIILLDSYLQGPWIHQVPQTDANHFLKKCVFGLALEHYEDPITPQQEQHFQKCWLKTLAQVRGVFSVPHHRAQLLKIAAELDQKRIYNRKELLALAMGVGF